LRRGGAASARDRGARGGRPRAVDAVVVAVVAGIAYASLARPGGFDCRGAGARLLHEWGGGLSGSDLLGNVFAYLLLGAALGFAWLARRPGGRASGAAALAAGAIATLAGATLSLSMEGIQACLPARHSSLSDVGANVAGTALGWLAARLVHPTWRAMRRDSPGRGDGRLAAVVALALAAWAIAETGPWMPAGSVGVARQHLRAAWVALGSGVLDPWLVARQAGEWLAVGLALALALRRPGLAVLPFCALAAAVLAWRLLLPIGYGPSAAALATLPAAGLLVLTVPMLGRRACAVLALAAVVTAMLAYQLQPAYGPAQPFAWRITVLSGDPVGGIRLACWFGWLAASVVAAGHAIDGRRVRWAALAVVLLAATEWAQTLLPGRTPDLSPVAVGLAAAALAAGMLGRRTRQGARHG
jgi:VanZ family protein